MEISEKKLQSTLLALLAIGILIISARFAGYLSFPESDYNFLGKDKKAKLDPGTSVMQVFEAKENNLDQIKILISNIDELRQGEFLLLELKDPNCEKTITEETIDWMTEDPKIYYRFRFPTIENSKGEKYCLKISYEAEEKRGGDERPYIAVSDNSAFKDHSYTDTAEGEIKEGRTLQIRPSYSTDSLWNDLSELENRLSQYKPGFIKGLILITGALSLLASILLGVFIIRTKE